MAEAPQDWLEELFELLRIPSVSADPERRGDVQRAAEWVRDFILAAGGEAEVVQTDHQPLVIGEIRASENAGSAPTVIAYGHFDVQPEAPLELWESPPFEPTVRDGWIYARGVADDKGQLYLLLKAAALLSAEGALPVNIRFTCDGEEESGGHSIVDFLEADERGRRLRHFRRPSAPARAADLRDRDAGHLLLPRARSDRRARSPLRDLRRRRAERLACVDADARRGSAS
jgi:acetylornithine deacetylase/succinyl-diaminopimelate desuccinylase-like protein